MPQSTDIPIFFITTGFPKSGNKWFVKMLTRCESIGGFLRNPQYGLPILGQPLVTATGLHDRLASLGVDFEDYVKKLLHPKADILFSLSDAERSSLRPELHHLTAFASRIAQVPVPLSRFEQPFESTQKYLGKRTAKAFGIPGMHIPIADIHRLFPSFHIVNVVRDPRDVVVSYFYHMIATLTFRSAHSLINVDTTTGELSLKPHWKQKFAKRFMNTGQRPDDFFPHGANSDRIVRVRYEDLLSNPVSELDRVVRELGGKEQEASLHRIVQLCSFKAITGGKTEQRARIVRNGQSGDWRNYFDKKLLDDLGGSFVEFVRTAGYETNDDWVLSVPDTAPKQFEFSRFRIKRSSCRSFIKYWDNSKSLREQYPNPWLDEGDDSYFKWLEKCSHRDVQEWFTLARHLEKLWKVDIVDNPAA